MERKDQPSIGRGEANARGAARSGEPETAAEKTRQRAETGRQEAIPGQAKAEKEAAAAIQAQEEAEKARQEAIAAQAKAEKEAAAAIQAQEAAEKARQEMAAAVQIADKYERARREAIAAYRDAQQEAEKTKQSAERARQEAVAAQAKAEQAGAGIQEQEALEKGRQGEERPPEANPQAEAQEEGKPAEETAVIERVYRGRVRLNLLRPVSASQMRQFQRFLATLRDVYVVSTGGSATGGPEITISVMRPLRLCEVLSNSQLVSKVLDTGNGLDITMR